MKSPIYFHPSLYSFTMRMLYGRYFEARYLAISDLIPEGSDVLEVCMGDAYLFRNYLKAKGVTYLGLDSNETFVKHAMARSIASKKYDLSREELPHADYVIIQASLYHFIPYEREIIAKLLAAANKKLIIAEPVRNLADSRNYLVATLAGIFSATSDGEHSKRFNEHTLQERFKEFTEFTGSFLIPGGREIVGVFSK